ncbi:MAG: MarR family transcriptional regulator [Telmatospirillum sp.]|nr:MarR family transcriptional regulator [Telmatospirillum sp.]
MTDPETLLQCLFKTTRAITHDLYRTLEPHGLFTSEWGLISLLHNQGPMSQAALAARLNIEPPAISKMLLRMEKRGLISRGPGSSRRENLVRISDQGLAQLDLWQRLVDDHHARILAGLSPAEIELLVSALSRIHENTRSPRE